jgi:hypothetical protein
MTLAIVRRGLPLAAAAILLMTGAVTAWAQNGRLTGTVTDKATNAPLENARIMVSGTSLIETTNRRRQVQHPEHSRPEPTRCGRCASGIRRWFRR